MKLLQAIKNFFAPQPKEPIVFVTPTPVAEPAPVVITVVEAKEAQPELVVTVAETTQISEVKVSPAKDWPTTIPVEVKAEVKASSTEAWPFPVAKPKKTTVRKTQEKKVAAPAIKATPAKKPAARTTSKKK